MIAIIRIKGLVDISKNIEATLERLRLKRKYSCVIVRENPEILGMLKKVENFVAYGKIDSRLLEELVEKRGKLVEKKKKTDKKKAAEEFLSSKTEKKLQDFNIKPFFRLHPPRGGIKSKLHYPKGVLGNHHDKISELIRRML